MWTVTRQRQWPDGDLVVEISAGSGDYTNPGALVERYNGEFEEFADPREAVSTAIAIAQAWQKDQPDEEIGIAHGATGGYTMPFSGEPLTEEVFADLRAWAEKQYEKLPKCDQCGEVMGKERYRVFDYDDFEFCREYCAEKFAEANDDSGCWCGENCNRCPGDGCPMEEEEEVP
jgi:hypothetical protein